jgi:hypothetical protein
MFTPTLAEAAEVDAEESATADAEKANCVRIKTKAEEKIVMCFILKILRPKMKSGKTKTSCLAIVVFSLVLPSCSHFKYDENKNESELKLQQDVSSQKKSSDESLNLRLPSAYTSNNTLLSRPVKYESCQSERKHYLEKQFGLIPSEYFSKNLNENQQKIPLQCIQLAQRSFWGSYAVCDYEEAKPKVSMVRPCMTERYVHLVSNAYHDVMDCFNLDPREMFYQIMIESGFHINAINKTGFDSGISQFTANGIKRVTANNLVERTRRVLLESSRPSCQRISSIVGAFDVDSFSVQKRCSMISLPKNPYRAMMFGYLHTMLDRISIEEKLANIPELSQALTDRIRRQLLYVSYNRGMTGLMRLLRGYIESREHFGLAITEDDLDLNKNLTRVKEILKLEPEKRKILKRAKVRNLSFAEYAVIHNAVYLSDMSAAREFVESYYGNACGDF